MAIRISISSEEEEDVTTKQLHYQWGIEGEKHSLQKCWKPWRASPSLVACSSDRTELVNLGETKGKSQEAGFWGWLPLWESRIQKDVNELWKGTPATRSAYQTFTSPWLCKISKSLCSSHLLLQRWKNQQWVFVIFFFLIITREVQLSYGWKLSILKRHLVGKAMTLLSQHP